LALLGRLPSAHVDGHVMQASEKPAHLAGICVAGRGGADHATLTGLADMALRALR
jgi:hypothetical protein